MENSQVENNTNAAHPLAASEPAPEPKGKGIMNAANYYFFINTRQKFLPDSQEARIAARKLMSAIDQVWGAHRYLQVDLSADHCTRNEINFYVELNEANELCAIVAVWIRTRKGVKYNHPLAAKELKTQLNLPYLSIYKERSNSVFNLYELAARFKVRPPPK